MTASEYDSIARAINTSIRTAFWTITSGDVGSPEKFSEKLDGVANVVGILIATLTLAFADDPEFDKDKFREACTNDSDIKDVEPESEGK